MKKRTVSAFTLVEMLIVIVIIGILIAALMPRMQAAQWRARDVSRKTALSQVQSAIVTSQWDNWEWPWECGEGITTNCAEVWMGLSAIEKELTTAWMNSVPVDPLKTEDVSWLWNFAAGGVWNETGDYAYMVTTRNWSEKWWFVLMAKTEVEWWSNWVVCDGDGLSKGKIAQNEDIVNIHPCTKFDKKETEGADNCKIENDTCTYYADSQLRYIVLY